MLSVDLTGNMGDQITRYVLCRNIAKVKGYEYGINKIPTHDYYNGMEQMDCFDIDYGIEIDTPYGQIPEGINKTWVEKYEDHGSYSYHPFQNDIFDIEDNTKLIVRCMHDARYYDKSLVQSWLKIKECHKAEYEKALTEKKVFLDRDLCVINLRGGEYRGVSSLFLGEKYARMAMYNMIQKNKDMRFVLITDDVGYFSSVFHDIPVFHFSIGCDFYILQHAKNLIISNSAFGIFSTWTNKNDPFVIAPKYWSRHNVSTGYWANSDMWTFGWNYMDRDGKIYDK